MKNTLVVNLFGGAGVGKSTLMAKIFAELKTEGYDCEMVTEFAKDLVWGRRGETFKDELYIFAKQNHRLFRVNGKVDIIVTDRPILLTNAYNQDNKELCDLCLKTFNQYNNLNFLLKRQTVYQENGRLQSEEHKKNLSEIRKGKYNPNAKPILMYDKKGNFIRRFDCIADATEYLGKDRGCSSISDCLAGSHKTAYGCVFKYAEAR